MLANTCTKTSVSATRIAIVYSLRPAECILSGAERRLITTRVKLQTRRKSLE